MRKLILIVTLFLALIYGTKDQFGELVTPASETFAGGSFQVESVIDGDTIVIKTRGGRQTVRLLGIDTPETDPTRGAVECYGKEATAKTLALLTGKTVRVETDQSQDTFDKYSRLLAYVYQEDGTLVNKTLVQEGYAKEFTFNKPYRYQEEFKKAERSAQAGNLGLWSCQKS